MQRPNIRSEWLGTVSYRQGLELQQARLEEVRLGGSSAVLWLEHTPVITLGRQAHEQHILIGRERLAACGVEIFETDRGGDVTFHGPGQLVVYPVLDLSPWNQDVRLYVRNLEEVVIRALAQFGLGATRKAGYPGVWIGSRKICAVGAKANRHLQKKGYIMTHGFAFNLDVDLAYFSLIVPCGIHGASVTSLKSELGQAPSIHQMRTELAGQFQTVFNVELGADVNSDDGSRDYGLCRS